MQASRIALHPPTAFHLFPRRGLGGGFSRVWILVVALVVLGAELAVLPARAGNVEATFKVTTNYYMISGATDGEIWQSLQQKRPWRDTAAHDGETAWDIRYHYQFDRTETGVRPKRFELKTTVTITLPHWQAPTNAPVELRRRWWGYLRALSGHEQGHLAYARVAAREMEQKFQDLGEFTNSVALRAAVDQTSSNVLARVRALEAAYDAKTRHGATEGALFVIGRESFETPPPPAK